jgi:hypothetical protein
MNKPSPELEADMIDTTIDEAERQFLPQKGAEQARFIRDLHYLYRKEEILRRASQRLLLSATPDEQVHNNAQASTTRSARHVAEDKPKRQQRRAWPKVIAALIAVLLLLGATFVTTEFARLHAQPASGQMLAPQSKEFVTPTVSATAIDKVIFSDPLSQNTHNWPVNAHQFFADGAYHIQSTTGNATAIVLQGVSLTPSWVYSLTMTEVQGNRGANDTFGVLFGYIQGKNGPSSFYTFELLNRAGASEVECYYYNNEAKSAPWKLIWHADVAFHQQLGQPNTVSVAAQSNHTLTFMIDGQAAGSASHLTLPTGGFGMFVNASGSEIAFQNMQLTRP